MSLSSLSPSSKASNAQQFEDIRNQVLSDLSFPNQTSGDRLSFEQIAERLNRLQNNLPHLLNSADRDSAWLQARHLHEFLKKIIPDVPALLNNPFQCDLLRRFLTYEMEGSVPAEPLPNVYHVLGIGWTRETSWLVTNVERLVNEKLQEGGLTPRKIAQLEFARQILTHPTARQVYDRVLTHQNAEIKPRPRSADVGVQVSVSIYGDIPPFSVENSHPLLSCGHIPYSDPPELLAQKREREQQHQAQALQLAWTEVEGQISIVKDALKAFDRKVDQLSNEALSQIRQLKRRQEAIAGVFSVERILSHGETTFKNLQEVTLIERSLDHKLLAEKNNLSLLRENEALLKAANALQNRFVTLAYSLKLTRPQQQQLIDAFRKGERADLESAFQEAQPSRWKEFLGKLPVTSWIFPDSRILQSSRQTAAEFLSVHSQLKQAGIDLAHYSPQFLLNRLAELPKTIQDQERELHQTSTTRTIWEKSAKSYINSALPQLQQIQRDAIERLDPLLYDSLRPVLDALDDGSDKSISYSLFAELSQTIARHRSWLGASQELIDDRINSLTRIYSKLSEVTSASNEIWNGRFISFRQFEVQRNRHQSLKDTVDIGESLVADARNLLSRDLSKLEQSLRQHSPASALSADYSVV